MAGFADDEGAAFGAHVLFAVEGFFDPDAVEVDEGEVGVGDEGEGQGVLFDELGVALDGVWADAEEEGFLGDLGPGVAEGAGLGGAAGGVVFGVEVEDDFLAAKVAEGEGGFSFVAAADDGGGEVGGEGVEGGFGHGGGGGTLAVVGGGLQLLAVVFKKCGKRGKYGGQS